MPRPAEALGARATSQRAGTAYRGLPEAYPAQERPERSQKEPQALLLHLQNVLALQPVGQLLEHRVLELELLQTQQGKEGSAWLSSSTEPKSLKTLVDRAPWTDSPAGPRKPGNKVRTSSSMRFQFFTSWLMDECSMDDRQKLWCSPQLICATTLGSSASTTRGNSSVQRLSGQMKVRNAVGCKCRTHRFRESCAPADRLAAAPRVQHTVRWEQTVSVRTCESQQGHTSAKRAQVIQEADAR